VLNHFASSRNVDWLKNSELYPVADSYINCLIQDGYSDQSIRTYTHGIAHFSYWMKNKRIPLICVNEATIDRFLFKHLPTCNCSRRCRRSFFSVRAALRRLLKVLRAERKISPFKSILPTSIVKEIARYDSYLQDICGLAKNTRVNRVHYVQAFLLYKFGRRAIIMKNIKKEDILYFIVQYSKGLKPTTALAIAGALRNYLRFRSFGGDYTEPLIAIVPSVAQWRLATVPKALPPTDIENLLNAFDRTTPIGLRDYAMVRCLIDLGLRAGEVAHLQIDDVNWRAGILKIKGAKGRRVQLLPLPSLTGKAIVDYLRRGRPITQSRALFVLHRGGVNCPVSVGAVCARVRLACTRCNITPSIGTHVLRHSVACRMLQGGASLKDIADILRHRSIDTTMIYAKVDIARLVLVAAPWPGRSS